MYRHTLSDPAQTALRAAARDLMVDADAVAAAVDDVICARLGIDDAAVRDSLAASTRAHVILIAGMIGAWSDPASAVPPPETLRWAADLVEDGRSATELLRAYRIGHGEVWRAWQPILRSHCTDAEVLDETTAATSAFLFDYVDTVLEPLVEHQAEAIGRRSARMETMRAETVRDLLTGERPDVQAAGARLRYAIDRWHVGVVLWALPVGTAEQRLSRLQAVAAKLDPAPLLAPGPGDVLHAWVASREPLELVASPGVVLAVGRPGRGLEGFRATHAEAGRALDVARAAGARAPAVVAYEDIEVVALLQGDREAADDFARRVLAPLSDELVATLGVLHEEAMSVARAAQRLDVHPNTVGYRVRRVLELTDETDAGSLRLRAAVALARFAAA